MTETVKKLLAQRALEIRQFSYSPYSGFAVGAALLCDDGTIFTGCNVESAAYSPTSCAERTALCQAVSAGHRHFLAIAIAGGPAGKPPVSYCYPCGVCRQMLREFDSGKLEILLVKTPEDTTLTTLAELLPHSFSAADL